MVVNIGLAKQCQKLKASVYWFWSLVAMTNVKNPEHWLTNAMLHATNAMLHPTNAMLPATNAMYLFSVFLSEN